MNGVPYKISKNIIGSMDIIDKISTHITPTVFKNTYPPLLKLNPKLLDHLSNLIWDETEKRFPITFIVNALQNVSENSRSRTY